MGGGGLAPRTAQQLQGVTGEAAHGGLVVVNLQELGQDDIRDGTIDDDFLDKESKDDNDDNSDYDDDSCFDVEKLVGWGVVTSPPTGSSPGVPPG